MAQRVTQVVAEVLESGIPKARATQVVAEALRDAPSVARASQLVVEVAAAGNSTTRATQTVILVLAPNYVTPMPLIYPNLPGLTYPVMKRPIFNVGIDTTASLREVEAAYASTPIWEWDLTYSLLDDRAFQTSLKTLMGLFLALTGPTQGMLFKDPDDFHVQGQFLGSTDNVTTNFTAVRTYGVAELGMTGTESVGQIDTAQPVHLYLDGVEQDPSSYDVLTTPPVANVFKFHNTPAGGHAVTADFDFYYYVRFATSGGGSASGGTDALEFQKFMNKLWALKKVTLRSKRAPPGGAVGPGVPGQLNFGNVGNSPFVFVPMGIF